MTIWTFALAIPVALIGASLYWSKVLSDNYKAWTTRLWSKAPYLRPMPQMAQLNLRISLPRISSGMWEEFCRQRILRPFFLPVNREDPPARSIGKQLKAVNSPGKRLNVLRIMSRFVGAKRMQNIAPLFSVPRNFFFREAIRFKVNAGAIDIVLRAEGSCAHAPLLFRRGAD